jgi:hypothetical protein
MMMEWHYNRLKALPKDPPDENGLSTLARTQERNPLTLDETDVFCVEKGWAKVVELEAKVYYDRVAVQVKLLTPEGEKAMADAEAAWEKDRKDDPEWGPAEFWVMDTTQGQLTVRVRVPQGCGEIAEHALQQKFGDCWPVPVRRQDDCHQWIGGLGAYLDAMHPERMPHWRSFTGRPLGDRAIEFKVVLGFPPAAVLR